MDDIRSAIETSGAILLYLPPYSPDWSPIEPCWSKLKTYLRGVKARTRDALGEALSAAVDMVTAVSNISRHGTDIIGSTSD